MAKYLSEEIEELKQIKKHIESIPKLPVDSRLYVSLSKTLRLLKDKNFTDSDASVCSFSLKNIIEPLLLVNNYNNTKFNTKDETGRQIIFDSLCFLDKIKAHRMMEEYSVELSEALKMNIFWVRRIEDWIPKSNNAYKSFKSIIEHLFCEYPVPEFMLGCWKNKFGRDIDWFLHLASGKSARELIKFPVPLTKKLAHEFINTPYPGYTIDDAIRRAQILSLGGDYRFADAILMSRLRHDYKNNDFWVSIFQYLINVDMLNMDEVGTILDYINEIKFVNKYGLDENGKRTYAPVNQNFQVKGRRIDNLIRDVQEWHKELSKTGKLKLNDAWTGTGIKPFIVEEGNPEKSNYKKYELSEITTSKELHNEGKKMHHCVFSYLSSCKNGNCSIFSLRLWGESLATIEVRGLKAVQIRAMYNKKPTDKEIKIIYDWSEKTGIQISEYAIAKK